MTTTHDTSISWTDCPVCAELNRKFERADAEADKAWETFSFFDTTYREAFAAGMVGFGTTAWTQWHDLLDQLRHAYYDATDTARARLDAWGESICEHAKPQPAAKTETPAAEPTPHGCDECLAARDHADSDDGEREERRRKAKEIIADYMGVPVDDVHIICSGIFGDGCE